MDQFTEKDIATLLRLKRHEQPLWRLALQRAHDFMFQLNVPTLASYPAVAAAIVVLATVLSFKVSQTPSTVNVAASTTRPMQQPAARVAEADPAWSLSTPVAMRDLGATPFRMPPATARTHRTIATPRYVLDSTPVSYEAALRF